MLAATNKSELFLKEEMSGLVLRGDGLALYGLDAENHLKIMAKRDPKRERKILEWIMKVTDETFDLDSGLSVLKSGKILCELANRVLNKKVIDTINQKKVALMEIENINK